MPKFFPTLLIALLTACGLVALLAYKRLAGPIILPENAWSMAAALIVVASVLWDLVRRKACCAKA